MQYLNKSQDSLSNISLHDCFINHVEWKEDSLVFYLDWIDVLKTHPFNTAEKVKIANNAALIFENAIEIYCIYYDWTKAYEKGEKIGKKNYSFPDDVEIIKSNIIERCKNVEISHDERISEKDKMFWMCSLQNNTEFKISYSTMWVCFNELGEDSWLEFQPK